MTANISNIKYLYELLGNPIRPEKNLSLDEKKLKEKVEKLQILIINGLESDKDFSISAYKFFDEVFGLRLHCLRFLLKEGIEIDEMYDNVLDSFSKKEIFDVNHRQLVKVVFSAIESLNRVGKAFVERENNPIINFDLSKSDAVPNISYDDFIKVCRLSYSSFPSNISKYFIDLFSSSLMLEISLFAAYIFLERNSNLNVSPKKIKELESLISKNTLIYFSSAVGLGMFNNEKLESKNDLFNSKSAEFKKGRRNALDFLAKEAQDFKLGY